MLTTSRKKKLFKIKPSNELYLKTFLNRSKIPVKALAAYLAAFFVFWVFEFNLLSVLSLFFSAITVVYIVFLYFSKHLEITLFWGLYIFFQNGSGFFKIFYVINNSINLWVTRTSYKEHEIIDALSTLDIRITANTKIRYQRLTKTLFINRDSIFDPDVYSYINMHIARHLAGGIEENILIKKFKRNGIMCLK